MKIIRRKPTIEEYPFWLNTVGSGYLDFIQGGTKFSWGKYKVITKDIEGLYASNLKNFGKDSIWRHDIEIEDTLTGKRTFCNPAFLETLKEFELI